MSTWRELLEANAAAMGDELLTLGPLTIGTGAHDRMGAQLLLHCIATYPDATLGEIEEAMHSALWWLTLQSAAEWGQRRAHEAGQHTPSLSASVAGIAGALAAELLRQRLEQGGHIEIPALGITITARGPAPTQGELPL